ncbi:GtrA family protein [Pedobacter sp. PWIIR3]
MKTPKKIIKSELVKFAFVGAFCAAIEFTSFYLLTNFTGLHYLIANILSVVLAITINYFLSRAYVFDKGKFSKRQEFIAFIFFSALGIGLNQTLLVFFVETVGIQIQIAKAFSIGLVATFNYLTKKFIVFRK